MESINGCCRRFAPEHAVDYPSKRPDPFEFFDLYRDVIISYPSTLSDPVAESKAASALIAWWATERDRQTTARRNSKQPLVQLRRWIEQGVGSVAQRARSYRLVGKARP